jgi:primosomal protein N' (replication factor Y) (superfamily II helicase)
MREQNVESREMKPFAEVVLLSRLDRVFHYSVPDDFRNRLEPGMRVLVPFRNGWRTGIVTRRLRRADVARVKPILEILDSAPLLDRPMMALARWLAEYYVTGWGIAMKAILPPGLEVKVGLHYRMTEHGRKAMAESKPRGKMERNILVMLARSTRGLRLEALARRMPAIEPSRPGRHRRLSAPLAALIRKGWVEETRVMPRRRSAVPAQSAVPPVAGNPIEPNPLGMRVSGTESVLEELLERVRSGLFATYCLGGEPEQLRSASIPIVLEAVRMGRSVIILVPEIDRLSQWVRTLKDGIGSTIGLLHSGLTDRERQFEWERARRGEVSVVVGTRLAVFAPVPNPGLIVVEDEQDPSYKQEESPRYHARDVAVLRAAHLGALAILTSASPSVETHANIQSGKYHSVRLDDPRSAVAMRPTVKIIDLAGQPRRTFVSDQLLEAVTASLDKKEPVVLLLNRKGFGTALYCRDCGGVSRCPRCQVAMVYSKKIERLICHYCGARLAPPTACPQCRGTHLGLVGVGTEQVEEFIASRFSGVRIERLDRDSARPGDVRDAIERLNRSEIHLALGTQILLNGPRLTRSGLIGLLDADGAFQVPDFRAGEQTFQLIRRVLKFSAGGEVIIQTFHPEHEAIAWAADGEPNKFYEKELAQRKALGYPPYMRVAVITVKALNERKASAVAERLAEAIKRTARHDDPQASFQTLGPAPALRPRLRGKFRSQILLKAPNTRILHEALQSGLRAVRSGSDRSRVWFEVDVDPQRIV